jgi:hypothetical protein
MRKLAAVLGLAIGIPLVLISLYTAYLFLWEDPIRELHDIHEATVGDGGITQEEFFQLKNQIRTTAIQGLAGIAVLVGLLFTGWSIRHSRESINLSRDKQIMELFSKAIELFDDSNHPSPLLFRGVIYAFERVSRDSKRDHWPIMEILTAYVRDRAKWKCDQQENEQQPSLGPPYGIQAILDALIQRDTSNENSRQRLNLSGTDLRGTTLRHAILKKANLSKSHLEGANLSGANLRKADLWEADLTMANLENSQLQGADLNNANLQHATLRHANLRGADMRNTKLAGADLTGANLARAHLEGVTLADVIGLTPEQIKSART